MQDSRRQRGGVDRMRGLFKLPSPMPTSFIPRDRQFWVYHCSALAFGLAVTITLALLWGYMARYQIATSIAWVPVYTLAALLFRWLYLRHGGETAPMARLIMFAVLYSAVAGLAMATIVQTSIIPFFFDAFAKKYSQSGMKVEYMSFLIRRIYEEGPQNQMFVLVWSFIYISVTANRRVKKTELFNLRLQNNLKEAQLSSLSNQLNPHFLFNSLNNIRFMIHENAHRADSMITSFSEILRYSLESSRHEKIGLGHEIAIIEKYIAVVSVQFEQRLRFEMRIPGALHEALVPPMVLQMLVENAVKHGIEHLPSGGGLTVDAELANGRLIFKVSNDAPAVPPAQAGIGIGLRNIAQRLELLYGERASMEAVPSAGRFCVTLDLPLERAA